MVSGRLSAKQREFAHHYSASHNASQAVRAAGYSELRAGRSGYELLRKPDVAALISNLDDEKRKATGVDEPWVVDQLKAIVEASMLGRPRTNARGELILDVRTGQPIIDTDYTNANIEYWNEFLDSVSHPGSSEERTPSTYLTDEQMQRIREVVTDALEKGTEAVVDEVLSALR